MLLKIIARDSEEKQQIIEMLQNNFSDLRIWLTDKKDLEFLVETREENLVIYCLLSKFKC